MILHVKGVLIQSNLNLHAVYGVCSSSFFHGHASIGMLSHTNALHGWHKSLYLLREVIVLVVEPPPHPTHPKNNNNKKHSLDCSSWIIKVKVQGF